MYDISLLAPASCCGRQRRLVELLSGDQAKSSTERIFMIKESLIAAAMSFPSWYGDVETKEDRLERLEVITTAIDQAVQIATCRATAEDFQEVVQKDDAAESETDEKSAKAKPNEDSAPVEHEEEPETPKRAENEDPVAPKDIPTESETSSNSQGEAPDAPDSKEDSSEGQPNEKAKKKAPSNCKLMWSGDPKRLAFMLLGQAFLETRLALHVHQGKCRKGECDSGKAISLWQLQYGPHLSKEEWSTLAGTDVNATRRAALEASRALSRGYNYCRSIPGAISLYATGRHCTWEPALKRAYFIQKLLNRY